MKKYAIAIKPEASDQSIRVYSDHYDPIMGRSTYVVKNLLDQWSLASGVYRPKLWATRDGAEESQTMELLRRENKEARVIELGPTDDEIRERAAFYVDDILSVLSAASVVPGKLSDQAAALIKQITR